MITREKDFESDYRTYSAIKVIFRSPRGTPMSFRNVQNNYFYPTLVFEFFTREVRDTDGFVTEKWCTAMEGLGYWTVINGTNGSIAPITNLLDRFIPGTNDSPKSGIAAEVSTQIDVQ
jgi:hypothetical protein